MQFCGPKVIGALSRVLSSWLSRVGGRRFSHSVFSLNKAGLSLMGTDIVDYYRRAAGYIARILQGAKPSELPIDQATKFELVINLKTAKTLGLTVPQILLAGR
jgi:hypothetical protein